MTYTLSMPTTKKLTYGVEVECAELSAESPRLEEQFSFTRHFDRTIRGPNGEELPRDTASELISKVLTISATVPDSTTPARLNGETPSSNPFQRLQVAYDGSEDVVKGLCGCLGKVNKSCGIHIHIGNPRRTPRKSEWSAEEIQTWLTVCSLLEERLFAIVPASRLNNQYCKKISESYTPSDFKNNCPIGPVVSRKYSNPKRYCWLNLIETKRRGTTEVPGRSESEGLGTVEIRMLGNTKRFEYIWAWTRLWIKIGTIIAFYPPSQAIMSLCISDLLDADFMEIKRIKELPENRRTNAPAPTVSNIRPNIRRADGN